MRSHQCEEHEITDVTSYAPAILHEALTVMYYYAYQTIKERSKRYFKMGICVKFQ